MLATGQHNRRGHGIPGEQQFMHFWTNSRRGLILLTTLIALCLPTGLTATKSIAASSTAGLDLYAEPLPALEASANVYYVSPNGSDSNPGTETQPWKTIGKAANTLVAGDTVIVNAGTYNEVVKETTSGNASSMISYLANGAVVIRQFYLQGNYIKLEGFTVTPTDCGWEGVQNNTVQDSGRPGIATAYTTDKCTIRENTITRTNDTGMYILGTNHLVDKNDISDIRDHGPSCSTWTDANGITFHDSGHTFRGNYIHDFKKSEQNGQPHADGFQTFSDVGNHKPAAKNVVIEGNHVFMGNTSTGVLEEAWSGSATICGFMIEGKSGDLADNLIIRNNIIASWAGLRIGGQGYASSLKIYNNVFRSSLKFSTSYWPSGIGLNPPVSSVSSFEIYNNMTIDFSDAHIRISNATGGKYDHNLMWNSDGSTPRLDGYTLQSHDKRGVDPKFVSNFGNLHLQSNSPAIDAGMTIAQVTNDYDGNVRPQGSAYDIGAFEYMAGGARHLPVRLCNRAPRPR